MERVDGQGCPAGDGYDRKAPQEASVCEPSVQGVPDPAQAVNLIRLEQKMEGVFMCVQSSGAAFAEGFGAAMGWTPGGFPFVTADDLTTSSSASSRG